VVIRGSIVHSSKALGTLSILLVVLLVAPSLASPVSAWFVREDPLKSSLASLPDEPLGTAPLTLRRQAYDIIRTIPGMEAVDADFSCFADRARLTSAGPIAGDLRLSKDLVRLSGSSGAGTSARDAAAQAVVLLVRADRDVVRVALADGELLMGGATAKTSSAHASAQRDYDRAMDSLRKGDLDKAVKRLASSLESSLEALYLMGVSYSPDADSEGDGLIDIIELRAGSSPLTNDTDGDGMGDYYEVFSLIPYCMPGDADTDDDGILDGYEDTDEDGSTNLQEMESGTNPLDAGDPGMLLIHEASDPLALGSPGEGLRVLLDLYHGEWDGSAVENMTLPINTHDLLESYGFAVDVNLHSPIDALSLSGYDALLMPSPMASFTAAELDAIKAFVSSGGGLLSSCDTQMSHGITAPNEVAGDFGVRYRSEWYANDSISAPTHPIMAGLSEADIFQPFMLFDAAIDRYPGNATLLTDGSYVTCPSMVALEYGSGRAVFGPNNGLCQPWGKGIDADPYYARDVPNILLIRTVEWLCTGSVSPPAPPPEGEDSDRDGLADAAEAPGIVDQFGALLMVDPYAGDTDADGVGDGDEAGEWKGAYWLTASNPVLNDTDWDGLDDLGERECGTDPCNRDSDWDALWDGEEVYEWGTDPLDPDTEGDGEGDLLEVAWGMDPLLYTERWDPLVATHEFCLGLIAGEFAMADHGNLPFFSGLMAGGAVSLVPVVGWLAGFLFDARDFLAALSRGDWSGLGINSLALLPYVGDAADIAGTAARFALKHPEMAGGIGVFLARVDWISEASKIDCIKAAVGEDVIQRLTAKGFDDAKIVKMSMGGLDLKKLNTLLQPSFDRYPGLPKYFEKSQVRITSDDMVMLRGGSLSINLKRLCASDNPNAIRAALGHIDGFYTETVLAESRIEEGWNVLRRTNFLNVRGFDFVAEKNGIVRVCEAKSYPLLSWKSFPNYFSFDQTTKKLWLNEQYFLKQFKEIPGTETAYKNGKMQIEIFINHPNYQDGINSIRSSLGLGPTDKILVYYTYTPAGGTPILHEIEVLLTGVLK